MNWLWYSVNGRWKWKVIFKNTYNILVLVEGVEGEKRSITRMNAMQNVTSINAFISDRIKLS